MRFLTFAVFSLFFSANAYASMSANDWQSQLQQQIQQLQTQSPSIHAEGNVSVEDSGAQLRAVLPALTIVSPDQSYWNIPSIVMQGTANSDSVVITLPSTITRYNAAKKPIATMNIGAQALNGHWNSAAHYFVAMDGTVKNVIFNDTISNAKTSISTVTLNANKGSPVEFIATDIRNAATQNQKPVSSAIAKATITYQIPNADQLTLAHLIGYFNPGILLAENKEVVYTINAEQFSMTGTDNRTTSLQRLMTKFDFKPQGKTVSGNITSQAFIVSQTPASAYSAVLPRQLELNASVNNLPVEMVSFAPGMSTNMAKSAMANAGTVINISKLTMTTFDQGKINGNGSFKADAETPSGFAGRLTLNIENLKDLITTTQMQMLQPDAGANRAAQTQSLMAMMMLQGMGKQNGTATQFVVDLTTDGQTLVNGQDLSGLIGTKGKAKTIETVPALPLTPVKSSNL